METVFEYEQIILSKSFLKSINDLWDIIDQKKSMIIDHIDEPA